MVSQEQDKWNRLHDLVVEVLTEHNDAGLPKRRASTVAATLADLVVTEFSLEWRQPRQAEEH